jgi:hypothetical protein
MHVLLLQGDQPLGPALSEQEFRMASGVFDPNKYEEYNRQVGDSNVVLYTVAYPLSIVSLLFAAM